MFLSKKIEIPPQNHLPPPVVYILNAALACNYTICRRPSHCLHFNGSNSNKQYNWLPIVLLLFKQTMTSGTRDSMKYIRRGEEGVRASDLGPSENQATNKEAFTILYKTLVRPILEYATPVWCPHLVRDILALEKIQRRASRLAGQRRSDIWSTKTASKSSNGRP